MIQTQTAPAGPWPTISVPSAIAGNEHFDFDFLADLESDGAEVLIVRTPWAVWSHQSSQAANDQLKVAHAAIPSYSIFVNRELWRFYHATDTRPAVAIILAALKAAELLRVASVYQVTSPDELTVLHSPA